MLNNLTLIIPAKEEKHSLPRVLNEIKDLGLKKLIILPKDDYETRNAIKNLDCEILLQNGNEIGRAHV